MKALRALSSRARITPVSFTNSYDWGDFRGDPAKLMETYFDLHLYLANWGSRRLMIRWPASLVDTASLVPFVAKLDEIEFLTTDSHLIVDISFDELELDDWNEPEAESEWLTDMAPLRSDVLDGDLRLFYLLWLAAVERDLVGPDEVEPLAGLGPLTPQLESFADFFDIHGDLVAMAAERPSGQAVQRVVSSTEAGAILAALSDEEKTFWLTRAWGGDRNVGNELRALVRVRLPAQPAKPMPPKRTAGEFRAHVQQMREARERAWAEEEAAKERQREEEARRARRARLDGVAARGERVWDEVEAEIARRNEPAYERALALLTDLQVVADESRADDEFWRRIEGIRERHVRKQRFIERLRELE